MKPTAEQLIHSKLTAGRRVASVYAANEALEAHGRRLVILVAQAEDGAIEVAQSGDDVELAASWFVQVAAKIAAVEDLLKGRRGCGPEPESRNAR